MEAAKINNIGIDNVSTATIEEGVGVVICLFTKLSRNLRHNSFFSEYSC